MSAARPRVTTSVEECAAVLRNGGTAIIPTDTVYGLAASLDHPAAISRLYELKGRPERLPIPVLVSSTDCVARLTTALPQLARKLVAEFWPGALTIIVEASEEVPDEALSGGRTVGLRMPSHDLALALIEACGGALAVTSANRSGEPETTDPLDAAAALREQVDVVLDGGRTPGGIASTVVDVTAGEPRILRHGAILDSAIYRAARD
jgi:L-threonylcarbamoyladenylate synthase